MKINSYRTEVSRDCEPSWVAGIVVNRKKFENYGILKRRADRLIDILLLNPKRRSSLFYRNVNYIRNTSAPKKKSE